VTISKILEVIAESLLKLRWNVAGNRRSLDIFDLSGVSSEGFHGIIC